MNNALLDKMTTFQPDARHSAMRSTLEVLAYDLLSYLQTLLSKFPPPLFHKTRQKSGFLISIPRIPIIQFGWRLDLPYDRLHLNLLRGWSLAIPFHPLDPIHWTGLNNLSISPSPSLLYIQDLLSHLPYLWQRSPSEQYDKEIEAVHEHYKINSPRPYYQRALNLREGRRRKSSPGGEFDISRICLKRIRESTRKFVTNRI